MVEADEILTSLILTIRQAIASGDWVVDGACDPDSALVRAEHYLETKKAPPGIPNEA